MGKRASLEALLKDHGYSSESVKRLLKANSLEGGLAPAGILAFTGDTGPHAGLADLTRGTALLCAECTDLHAPASDAVGAAPDYPAEAGRRHLAWDDLRAWLPGAGVRRIALGHLGPEARAGRSLIEADARSLGLDLLVCDDLDEIAF